MILTGAGCLAETAAIMGTDPREIFCRDQKAYEHFFEGLDKGQQNF
jgi:hypothetical protein